MATKLDTTSTFGAWALRRGAVLETLDTSLDGLSSEEANKRLTIHGRNELPAPKPPTWAKRFLDQFDDVLMYILIGAAVLKAVSGSWVDFTVITVVILASAIIGIVQEGKAASALAGLQSMQSLNAEVRRNGTWVVVDSAELVPGDVIRMRSGAKVPADLRLLTDTNLRVDESALTGESEAVTKDTRRVSADTGIGDRTNMLFSGTIVTSGAGQGVVVGTGLGTEIGKISRLVSEQEQIDTPLNRQLAHLGKQISLLIAGMAMVMVLVGRLVHHLTPADLLEASIGFAVAAVPEGLPALVTITLALGVQQMAKRNAITRKMEAVETLGAVTTICSDKTGTLTQNEMTARVVVTTAGTYHVEGTGYDPEGRVVTADGTEVALEDHRGLAELVIAGGVSNDAGVEKTNVGWRVVGQPTEGALDVLATKAGVQIDEVRRIDHVPFDSTHKFLASLDEVPTADGDVVRMIHAAGAPDRLMDRSTHERNPDGELVPINREAWEEKLEALTDQGLRVLAAASKPGGDLDDLEREHLDTGLTFLGLVGIVDPPRPEVMDAIKDAHDAGIRVKMITGDHKGTATAIARELHIAPEEGEVPALTGVDIEGMTQDELRKVVQDVDVYTRTSPEHKLRIVRALQSHGEVVAMTGDGVNDAPSITRANVGVAMGIKGTEATKEAADIVLADDNFATIERAVEEGRRIYDNIRKSVIFLLPANGAQSLVILVAIVFGLALPLTPLQILWVNLVTAVTLGLSLVSEPAEPGIMKRPPRPQEEQVLTNKGLWLVLAASLLVGGSTLAAFVIAHAESDTAVAQTTAVTMLVVGQIAYLFNCRVLSTSALSIRVFSGNRTIWTSVGLMLLFHLIFVFVPFMQSWFGSAVIPLSYWLMTIGFAVGIFLVVEGVKAFLRKV